MSEADRIKYLRVVLVAVGLVFIFGIYPLTIVWPSGWSWHNGQSDYLQMILGIYATLGVFLIIASSCSSIRVCSASRTSSPMLPL